MFLISDHSGFGFGPASQGRVLEIYYY